MKMLKLTIALPLMAIIFLNASAKNPQARPHFITLANVTAATNAMQKNGNPVASTCLNEKSVRVYNNGKYQIFSNTGIIIHSKTWLVQQGKGAKPTELYFFSAGESGAIRPLTLANLESVYGKNQKFIYAAKSLFKNDAELASYDYYNKQFKLAYLYSQNVI